MNAIQLIEHLGWTYKPAGGQACVQTCPYCGNTNYKFFVNISEGEQNGLHDCKVCGQFGNLYKLKQTAGVSQGGITSMKDAAIGTPSALPNMDLLHKSLMDNEKFGDVLDYLIAERGFSLDTITKCKLGAVERDGQKYVIYPYFDAAGSLVFFKGRSISPPKKFIAPSNRPTPLFNSSCLKKDMEELYMVEGEADCIALLNQGVTNVVGVPGAGLKKAEWIDALDKANPKNIYLVYDSDKAGQTGALELARRIGIDKVKNILLPQFNIDESSCGKDVNEWFKSGKTLEEFTALKESAKLFDVFGVSGLVNTLEDFKSELQDKGSNQPTYPIPWASLGKKLGGCEPGDVIGVIAEGKVGKTTLCLNWLDFYSEIGYPSMMFCLEMLPKRMVRKWVSKVTNTPDDPQDSKITDETIDQAIEIAKGRSADLLFAYTRNHKIEEVADLIRQAVRRYGVKFVCFDNLQILGRSIEHQNTELGKYSKMFKELAMELGIVLLLIIQPHRVPEGQIVSARNALGTSSIEKDVDAMVCCHRNRTALLKKETDFKGYIETEATFDPQLLLKVDLCRYGSGGICTLWFDGSTSSVREMLPDDMISPESSSGFGGIQVEGVSI